mmetsp:Transcript_30090/g.59759  ORF Transcript_30090/g.59759 Transcript_30090/m.59759 type:complete len:217 (-) Transcript_30090:1197-1847(-)
MRWLGKVGVLEGERESVRALLSTPVSSSSPTFPMASAMPLTTPSSTSCPASATSPTRFKTTSASGFATVGSRPLCSSPSPLIFLRVLFRSSPPSATPTMRTRSDHRRAKWACAQAHVTYLFHWIDQLMALFWTASGSLARRLARTGRSTTLNSPKTSAGPSRGTTLLATAPPASLGGGFCGFPPPGSLPPMPSSMTSTSLPASLTAPATLALRLAS